MGRKQPRNLKLNRETVRDLTSDDLLEVQGGKKKTYEGHQCPGAITTDPSLFVCCPPTCGIC